MADSGGGAQLGKLGVDVIDLEGDVPETGIGRAVFIRWRDGGLAFGGEELEVGIARFKEQDF